ncbi:M20 metallopeptidase family protein [Sporanaerobacter acetigenes]|uniref:M20 metallopeptidase family protein n=1 Tax=Sporanaerobacter acetigenes TaxID=165813 RepID=UPI001043996E|nr:amidohydrolase [Sporanaerobacter acetigenes]
MINNDELKKKVSEIEDWVVLLRRDFHMHPELGMEEYRTSEKIVKYLDEMGIPYTKGMANTGVVGIIKGVETGKTVALRADMDALPIVDRKDVPYKSQIGGKMHACGHDAHTAILLGTAKVLNDLKKEFKGNVKLIFQPAEETTGGAKPMIEEGVLENPKVDGIFGLHVYNDIDVGKIGIKYGQMNASSDMIKIIIHGENSHGAYPHLGVDAIAIASQVIVSIQTIVSRNVDPRNSSVISLGTIHGGDAGNVIADRVEIEGIVRTLDSDSRENVMKKIVDIVEGVSASMGGSGEVIRRKSYDALINDDTMVDIVYNNIVELFGNESVVNIKYPSFGVEDFAYFAEECPGAFFNLGSRNQDKGIIHEGHTPYFDIDEDCLKMGVLMQVKNVLTFLNEY